MNFHRAAVCTAFARVTCERMRILSGLLSSVTLVLLSTQGCSSSSSSKPTPSVGLSPGDHFFDSVATTTGAANAPSFQLAVVTFDPKEAPYHQAGTPGSDANIQEAAASVATASGQTITLDGTWASDGTLSLQGGGWTLQGTIASNVVTGSFQGSGGVGVFAGADIQSGGVSKLIGLQNGVAFDLVILEQGLSVPIDAGDKAGAPTTPGNGIVTGVIGGQSGGFITGTASGSALSYSWQANGSNGTGTGTLAASGGSTGVSQVQSASCSASPSFSWWCEVYNPGSADPYACQCAPNPGAPQGGETTTCTSPAGNWTCCVLDTADPVTQGVDACSCWSSTADCNTYGGPGTTLVPSCPSGPLPSGSSSGSGSNSDCSQSWQATPAPNPLGLAYDPCNTATIPGGNCTWFGACACPANFGCAACGACCIP